MNTDVLIRDSAPQDARDIQHLYGDAFPDEPLWPLVEDLLQSEEDVINLVAVHDDTVVGHIAFTTCQVAGATGDVALLAPLAVSPPLQKQGIGGNLVRAGFKALTDAGIDFALVLGDPAYYSRFGFAPEAHVLPPYPLPDEWQAAWQAIVLVKDGKPLPAGKLLVPELWQQADLWGP